MVCAEGSAGVFPGEELGDSYRIVRAVEGTWEPINLCVQVPALPRACSVELQPLCAVASSAASVHACNTDSEDSGSFQVGLQGQNAHLTDNSENNEMQCLVPVEYVWIP